MSFAKTVGHLMTSMFRCKGSSQERISVILQWHLIGQGVCCRPAGTEVAEEGKKKTEEEIKAEQETVNKEQTAALKKALSQITVSLISCWHLLTLHLISRIRTCHSPKSRIGSQVNWRYNG